MRIRFVGEHDQLLSEIRSVKYRVSEKDAPELDEDDVVYFNLRESEQQEIVHKSLYIQMELCKRPLYDAIVNGIGYEEGMEYFKQIASAVTYMHINDIVHRDLSSQNIFICESTKIKIGDFGIAQIIGEKFSFKKSRQCILLSPREEIKR